MKAINVICFVPRIVYKMPARKLTLFDWVTCTRGHMCRASHFIEFHGLVSPLCPHCVSKQRGCEPSRLKGSSRTRRPSTFRTSSLAQKRIARSPNCPNRGSAENQSVRRKKKRRKFRKTRPKQIKIDSLYGSKAASICPA